jgi:hypothetical protein
MLLQPKWLRKVPEMKKASEVFSSIRFAKGKSKDKPHLSTDNEEHYTVGEKEYEQQIKHVKKMAMQEQSDTMEKVEMVKSQLHFIKYACEEILEYIDMGGEVEEWYQVKVAKSFSEFESLHAFMEGESRRKGMKEEVEQLDELSPSTISSYKTQAQKSIQQLKPHAEKGEYRDIAKNIMQRRTKGLAAAMKREEVEQLDEKNVPTNPELWSRAKALARSKFDVYPSAYANGWASKWYKGKGGGWRSVSEEVEQIDELKKTTLASYAMKAADQARNKKDAAIGHVRQRKGLVSSGEIEKSTKADKRIEGVKGAIKRLAKEEKEVPFEPTKEKQKVVPGKHGKGYSTARHLARMAMKKQVEKLKKPVKESLEESRKVEIVKEIMKKKKESEDTFQKDPTLTSQVQKVDNAVT